MGKIKTFVFTLIILFVMVMALIIFAEITLRLTKFTSNVSATAVVSSAPNPAVINQINRYSQDIKFDPAKKNILCIGDSFTWGEGVRGDKNWPAVLSKISDYNVVNGGMSQLCNVQEYVYVVNRNWMEKFKPDILILEITLDNDIIHNLFHYGELSNIKEQQKYTLKQEEQKATNYVKANFPAPRQKIADVGTGLKPVPTTEEAPKKVNNIKSIRLTDIKYFLATHTRLFPFISDRLHHVKIKPLKKFLIQKGIISPGEIVPVIRISMKEPIPQVKEGYDITKKIILKFDKLARDNSAKLIVLIFPSKVQVDDNMWQKALNQNDLNPDDYDKFLPHRILGKFLKENNIKYIDLMDDFIKAVNQGQNPYLVGLDNHPDELGHKIAAEILNKNLK